MEKLGSGDPHRIGAYRLLARLGAGGMGRVYLARSDRGRTVAVKLVHRELAEREEFRARFRQEVRAARRVGGHWTAPVLDADTEAAIPWVATGYVAGPSLQEVVGRDHGALPERSVRILAAGLAHALKDIHAAGLVHRDLKPSNVLVTIDGPRVIDFGVARALETVTDGGLTRTGALVGSPGFMAPEQVRGDRLTPACDVFCLGSVLSYAATGSLPFGSADSGAHALMFRIAQEEPDLTGVPEGTADLVRQCLRKDPAARPTPDDILRRTGAEDTVADGRSRDPWLPGLLVAQLGRHAVHLLNTEAPEEGGGERRVLGERDSQERASQAGSVQPGSQRPGPQRLGPPQPGAMQPGLAQPGPVPPGPVPPSSAPPGPVPPGPALPGSPEAQHTEGRPPQPGPPQPGSPEARAPEARAPEEVDGTPDGVADGPANEPESSRAHPHPRPRTRHPYPSFPPGAPPRPRPPSPDGTVHSGRQGTGGAETPAPLPPPGTAGTAGTPFGDLPTTTAGLPGTLPPAHGHPARQQPPAWPTPPYGPGTGPGMGTVPDTEQPRRGTRSTALLVAVALVVALTAGASVYALVKGDDTRADTGPTENPATGAPVTPGPSTRAPSTRPSGAPEETPAEGAVPAEYLGTWTASIDNDTGRNTRRLTVRQGGVGDTVLSLTADGPAGSGTYHCVFRAALAEDPGAGDPLRIGPSEVTAGEPATSCSPGGATELTVLPDGRLRRVNTTSGEELTYTKQ